MAVGLGWKIFLTVVGALVLIWARLSPKVFKPNWWIAVEKTELADMADSRGNWLPGVKLLIYLWIPFFVVATWLELPVEVDFIVFAVLIVTWNIWAMVTSRSKR